MFLVQRNRSANGRDSEELSNMTNAINSSVIVFGQICRPLFTEHIFCCASKIESFHELFICVGCCCENGVITLAIIFRFFLLLFLLVNGESDGIINLAEFTIWQRPVCETQRSAAIRVPVVFFLIKNFLVSSSSSTLFYHDTQTDEHEPISFYRLRSGSFILSGPVRHSWLTTSICCVEQASVNASSDTRIFNKIKSYYCVANAIANDTQSQHTTNPHFVARRTERQTKLDFKSNSKQQTDDCDCVLRRWSLK